MLAEQATTTWLDVTNAALGLGAGAMILAVLAAVVWDLAARRGGKERSA